MRCTKKAVQGRASHHDSYCQCSPRRSWASTPSQSMRLTKTAQGETSPCFTFPLPLVSLRPSGELTLHTHPAVPSRAGQHSYSPLPWCQQCSAGSRVPTLNSQGQRRQWDAELVGTPLLPSRPWWWQAQQETDTVTQNPKRGRWISNLPSATRQWESVSYFCYRGPGVWVGEEPSGTLNIHKHPTLVLHFNWRPSWFKKIYIYI